MMGKLAIIETLMAQISTMAAIALELSIHGRL